MRRLGLLAPCVPAFLLMGVTHCSIPSAGPPGGAAGSTSALGTAASAGSAGAASQTGLDAAGGSAPLGSGGLAASVAGAAGSRDLGPTRASATANFPFPQNRLSAHCRYPAFRNSDVRAAYQWWKAGMVTADGAGGHLRVKRTPTDGGLQMGSTVSEGIGYGMLIAVYMNDQPLFDELWKYEQQWLNKYGLMDWNIDAAGSKVLLPGGAASDADEDMAFALLMADRQWGGSGSLGKSYLDVAKGQISNMWDHEIHEGKLLKPGDSWDLRDPWTLVNVSYFAPSYYRAFALVSGNMGWNDVVNTSYDTLENSLNESNGNTTNGLVPAWSTSAGAPTGAAYMGAPTNYQYDSCRTPFRIGIDYCVNAEPRAKSYAAKTSQFFAGIGASQIVDGYELNGTPKAQNNSGQSAAFVGTATVGAMTDAAFSTLLEQGYTAIATRSLLVGGEYYDGSWTMISLLMLSGNFLDYTKEQPFSP